MSLAPDEPDVPHVRILQCFECKSMQVIPDYQGDPEYDVYLHDIDIDHGGHEDDPLRRHLRTLHRVNEALWDNMRVRRQMVKEMWSGVTGFVPEYYDAKKTFQEDASKCYSAHKRPGVGRHLCSDYRSDRKRIGNPARKERAQLARDLRMDDLTSGGPKVYLCDLCPYQMEVQRMKADRYGDFSEKLN